jgi:glycosyltransferase involved in cell wall biosynthesis
MSQSGAGRRALVVTCNFPPDAAVGTMRTLRLVRHLAGESWDVDVVTVSPAGFRPGTVVDPALVAQIHAGVTVLAARPLRPLERLTLAIKRLGRRPAQSGAGAAPRPVTTASPPPKGSLAAIRRRITAVLTLPDREVSWLIPAVWAGWQRARRAHPSVIYSSGPPFTAHLVALVLGRLTGAPWVADFRDPWARAPWREDRFEFERRAWSFFERQVVTRARAVVFVTTTNRDDFAGTYGATVAERFAVVSNGCDATDFVGLVPAPPAAAAPFVLLHAGSLYGGRNPAGLLRAVANAVGRRELDPSTFRLRFLGRIGIPGLDLKAVALELGLDRVVEFVSHVPRRESLQQMLDASALLIVQPVTTVSIPAKLYEYMAAGRPILGLAEPGGETASLIERAKAGITVLADDEQAIIDGLVAVVKLARSGFTPVDRQVFDGALRAAELRTILSAVAASQTRADA